MTPVPAIDRLIEAWVRWEATPGSRVTVVAKQQALHAVGLDSCRAHEAIAVARRRGMSVPDAVQSAINDCAPHLSATVHDMELKEAC